MLCTFCSTCSFSINKPLTFCMIGSWYFFCIRVATSTCVCLNTGSCTSRSCSNFSGVFTSVSCIFGPRSGTLIPGAFCHCIKCLRICRNCKVGCLVPLIVPVVSGSTRIHTAEDHTGISKRKFCGINAGISNLSHINPSFTISEEVNCESCAFYLPVSIRLKVNYYGLWRYNITDSFFSILKSFVSIGAYPVVKTVVNEVSGLSRTIIEDNIKTFNRIDYKSNCEPTVHAFNSSHRCAGPFNDRISEPSIKVYVCPFCSVVVKCYLARNLRFIFATSTNSTIFDSCICFFVYFPIA